jgi:hypothetical protein
VLSQLLKEMKVIINSINYCIEMEEFLASLRITLIDCYTTIVHGVKNTSNHGPLIQHCPVIFSFLEQCVEKRNNPTKVSSNLYMLITNRIP